jgi:hypothetical protein
MRHRFDRQVLIAAMVITAVGFGAFGQQRAGRISRQAASANQNQAVVVQTNCVNAPAMPDIVLHKVTASGSSAKPKPGEWIDVGAVLENRGQCETGSFKVQFFVYFQIINGVAAEKLINTTLVQSIQPTREKEVSYTQIGFRYQLDTARFATYDFYATADPENKVSEFIEDNNIIGKQMAGHEAAIEVMMH